jgi:hypothetical protein
MYLTAVSAVSASLALWQQTAIDRVHENITRLGRDLLTLRESLEADQSNLRHARHQVDQFRQSLRDVLNEQSESSTQLDSEFTPAREGWWPENRPYFYLPKRCLAQVRFGEARLTSKEAEDLLARKIAASIPGVAVSGAGRDVKGDYSYTFRLFDEVGLNPDAAALLGMNDAEQHAVTQAYQGLFHDVQVLEAARAVPVIPPQPVSADAPDELIVARIPDLTEAVQAATDAMEQQLSQSLGTNRVGLLSAFVRDYADTHLDSMGRMPRKFVRIGTQLQVWVGGSQQWAPLSLQGRQSGYGQPLEYSHIFGPGAPCELK